MSFRLRVTLAAAVAVALAVAPPRRSSTSSSVTSSSARSTAASSPARTSSPSVPAGTSARDRPGRPDRGISGSPYLQVISTSGDGAAIELPCMSRAEDVAAGDPPSLLLLRDIRVSSDDGGTQSLHVRVYAEKVADGFAAQVARPLDEVDHTLGRLGTYLLIIGVGGVVIAGALGMLVGAAALRPVGQLTEVAEEVAATRDLSRRIGTSSRDEARTSRDGVQPDAHGARQLGARAAPARRRRVSRAADAAREPQNERRGARGREDAARGGAQEAPRDVIGQVEAGSRRSSATSSRYGGRPQARQAAPVRSLHSGAGRHRRAGQGGAEGTAPGAAA